MTPEARIPTGLSPLNPALLTGLRNRRDRTGFHTGFDRKIFFTYIYRRISSVMQGRS